MFQNQYNEVPKSNSSFNHKDDGNIPEEIYIFCPGFLEGIKFTNCSPNGLVAKLLGSLPVGVFLADNIAKIQWNEQINGRMINDDYTIKNNLCDIHNKIIQKLRIMVPGGSEVVSQNVVTLIVSRETMLSLLEQIQNKVKSDEGDYTVLDLNKKFNIKEPHGDYFKSSNDNNFEKEYDDLVTNNTAYFDSLSSDNTDYSTDFGAGIGNKIR